MVLDVDGVLADLPLGFTRLAQSTFGDVVPEGGARSKWHGAIGKDSMSAK